MNLEEDRRHGFEAHFNQRYFPPKRDESGTYLSDRARDAWQDWQAACAWIEARQRAELAERDSLATECARLRKKLEEQNDVMLEMIKQHGRDLTRLGNELKAFSSQRDRALARLKRVEELAWEWTRQLGIEAAVRAEVEKSEKLEMPTPDPRLCAHGAWRAECQTCLKETT